MSKPDPMCPDVEINAPGGPVNRFVGKYRVFSNFGKGAVMFDGNLYQTLEAAWHASKTLDPEKRSLFQECHTAWDAWKLGAKNSKTSIITTQDLVETRDTCAGNTSNGLLEQLVRDKAARNPEILALLLSTGDVPLIEGRIPTRWGGWHGYYLPDGSRGCGTLGELWMKIREEFRGR